MKYKLTNNQKSEYKCLYALSKNKMDNKCVEICRGLFISSLKAALCKNTLIDIGITHVLTVMEDI